MPSDLSARASEILAALRELERVCATQEPSVELIRQAITVKGAGDLLVSARTALPVLVRIAIAEMERAQGCLEDAESADRDAAESDTNIDASYYAGSATNLRECAEEILDRWSAILPQPEKSVGPAPGRE